MNDSLSVKFAQRWKAMLVALLALGLVGCPDARPGNVAPSPAIAESLQAVNLSDPIRPVPGTLPILLRAARNEWTSFTLQVSGVSASRPMLVRIGRLQGQSGQSIELANLQAYQILPMPIEVNPGYVRHTGLNTANRSVPRALLPAAMDNGSINLADLRDPTQPTNPATHPNGSPVLLWIDLHVPSDAPAGEYTAACDMLDGSGRTIGAPVPVKLTVYDFTLPDQRHLQMIGQVNWDRLAALYPEQFGDTITPSLINRADPRYAPTVGTLDRLMVLSQRHRAALAVAGLRPTVKWPPGEEPQIDWREFDSLVGPWLRGEMFPDHVPLQYWPLPAAQSLDRYDPQSRIDYWTLAANHFDQLGWLDRSPIALQEAPGQPAPQEAGELTAEAAQILARHPKVRVLLPLEDDQLAQQPQAIKPADLDRVLTSAPGLVSSEMDGRETRGQDPDLPVPPSPRPRVPASPRLLSAPWGRHHWLCTDLPGLVPYAGAGGDERDVRVWAWLAFLRQADLIVWSHTLPAADAPGEPADPNTLVWFYPGRWFGVSGPVPTIQLKWLRRAQQDYEYLWLARQRGEVINALQMARLITKPVEILPGQRADPAYSLMSGTTSQQAWDRAQELLAQTILLRKPGQPVDESRQRELYIQTLQWAQPQERPLLLARAAQWTLDHPQKDGAQTTGGNWVTLQLALDIYNASDVTPDKNQLQWDAPPADSGWEMHPQPVEIPRLQTYHVQPATLFARFDLNRIEPPSTSSGQAGGNKPIELSFINGFTRTAYPMQVRLPVAVSDRREGPIVLDGKLADWTDADAMQNGPLLLMMNRPNLQKQQLQWAPMNAKIYSAWGRDNFYLAFSLEGLSPESHQAHNDVDYQSRRAWGEDLCEVLIQPVYADNTLGPVLHVVFKPNGADWVEQEQHPEDRQRSELRSPQPMEGSGIRYATTTTTDGHWHGEAGIPWKLIIGPLRQAQGGPHQPFPVLLRFNFCQHRQANCESASWCGPVDFGRDPNLMGVLYLRGPDDVGMVDRTSLRVLGE